MIKGLTKAVGTLLFYRSTGSFPAEGDPMPRSQRTGFPVADEYKLMPTSAFIATNPEPPTLVSECDFFVQFWRTRKGPNQFADAMRDAE